MTSEIRANNEISIVKEWKRTLGWVALASFYKEGRYFKTKNEKFLSTKPINEQETQLNYKKKSNIQSCVFPDDYSGLIISSSQYEGTRCERYYWFVKNGNIIKHDDNLDDLFGEYYEEGISIEELIEKIENSIQ